MDKKELPRNQVFFENLKTLIRLAKNSLKQNECEQIDFRKSVINANGNYDFAESAHLANADWILLNSIFVSMFSHLEYKLFLYCKAIEKDSAFKIKLENLSGSTLIKYFNYLNLVANVKSASKDTISYQNLILFQKVRNTLVHNGGVMITDKNKKIEDHVIYNFLKNKKVAMGGSSGIIRIKSCDFLEDFYSLCKTICNDIAMEINKNFR